MGAESIATESQQLTFEEQALIPWNRGRMQTHIDDLATRGTTVNGNPLT